MGKAGLTMPVMKFLAYFRCVAAKFFHRSRMADDMAEDLRSHIQHRADDLERSGLARRKPLQPQTSRRLRFPGMSRRARKTSFP